jgi:hypothetical protein
LALAATQGQDQHKVPTCDHPEILAALRRPQEDVDRAVLAAYRWSDINVPPVETPNTTAARTAQESFEDEIIDRLFALNAEMAEKEKLQGAGRAAAISAKKASRKIPKPAAADNQLAFGDQPNSRRSKS